MHMREGEVMQRVIRRHLTPYVISLIAIALLSVPLFFLAVALRSVVGEEVFFWLLAIAAFFVGLLVAKRSIDFLLDKLVVTNKRIIHSNWHNIFRREEDEIELHQIQDVRTIEKGIFAELPFFDYGTLEIETAASTPSIVLKDCPDPDSVKHFILGQRQKEHGGHS